MPPAVATTRRPIGISARSSGTTGGCPSCRSTGSAATSAGSKRNRTRVVVFHAITQELKGGYYGILTQGFPQLVRVNADVLGVETEQPLPAGFPALCRARMIHEYPLIPDVERLEKMIAEMPL